MDERGAALASLSERSGVCVCMCVRVRGRLRLASDRARARGGGGRRSDFSAQIGSLLRHPSLLRQMVLPSADGLGDGGGANQGLVKVRGRQQQRGCALGQGAASARVTDTKTDAHTKAAAGLSGRRGNSRPSPPAAGPLLVPSDFHFRHPPPPTRPDTRRHTSASTSIPVSYLRHPNPTVPLFLGGGGGSASSLPA